MRRTLPLLFLMLAASMFAQNVGTFSDTDYQNILRSPLRVLFYSVSPAMPLSVAGLKEIRGAADDLHARLVVLADPAATAKEIESIGDMEIRWQKSKQLRDRGIQLHYPSVVVIDSQKVAGGAIGGFKSRESYVALISDLLKLQWKEEFRVTDKVPLPRQMNMFFKPIYGTELIASGNANPNFLLNTRTRESFSIPNAGWGDPGASRDGEFVTLLGSTGLSWYSTANILAGKPESLLWDPGLRTYQSMGQLTSGVHRVLGAVTSSTNPSGLIVREYEKRARPDGRATVAPLKEWRSVCEGKNIAIPMLSKTGLYLSGSHEGTMRVFRIGREAAECEEIFDSKLLSGKADFSVDDRFLIFVSRIENPTTHLQVDAIVLANLQNRTTRPIYYAAPEQQLAFPGFMSPDRIVVYDSTSRHLFLIDRTRRVEN